MAIDVRMGTQTVSVDLGSLKQTSGTLYLKDGVIQESKHSFGRALLGLFSPTIRAENRAALEAVSTALKRVHGYDPPRAQGMFAHISGPGITRLDNRTKMQSFIHRMSTEYRDFSKEAVKTIRDSGVLGKGRALSEQRLAELESQVKAKEAEGLRDLGTTLRTTDMTGREVMEAMRGIPRLANLFDGQAGIGGRDFTVGVHTGQVMDQFEGQKQHYDLSGIQQHVREQPGFENFNAERFMKVVLALHDIGKSLCSDTTRQHEFTMPILRDVMNKMGFSEQEVRLAGNLVDNDLLGDWQQGKTHDVGEVRGALRELAQDSGVPMKDFLAMQKLFYISDSSSYEPIRSTFMRTDDQGKLHFTENRTDDVLESFREMHGALGKAVSSTLLSPKALADGETHPISLFSQSLEGTGANIYDLSRLILENKAELEEKIGQMEPEQLREVAAKRLQEAVEMATTALKMDADHWKAEHTQGVLVARMEIRQAGITELLPRSLSAKDGTEAYFGNLDGMDGLRGQDSVSDKFFALVDAKGGSSRMLQVTGQCQVVSSWSPTSMAVKGYLIQSRSVSGDHFFQATSDQHGAVTIKPGECYEKFAHAPGSYWDGQSAKITGSTTPSTYQNQVLDVVEDTRGDVQGTRTTDTTLFDTSMRYQIAMQMEMLQNFQFPGNNPEKGTLTLYRTEAPGVLSMYGIDNPGDSGVMKRGASDSSSILCPVMGTGGMDVTTTEVPHHRVFGSFFLGAGHSSQGDLISKTSMMMGNEQREMLFMSDGLVTRFEGDGQKICSEFMRQTTTVGTPMTD